jgi:hypothetical protein
VAKTERTYRLPLRVFPCCGYEVDAHTGQLEGAPAAGDLTVCAKCGAFLMYTDSEGATRRMTPRDAEGLDQETLHKLQMIRHHLKQSRLS